MTADYILYNKRSYRDADEFVKPVYINMSKTNDREIVKKFSKIRQNCFINHPIIMGLS